jgi:hypothetical protein
MNEQRKENKEQCEAASRVVTAFGPMVRQTVRETFHAKQYGGASSGEGDIRINFTVWQLGNKTSVLFEPLVVPLDLAVQMAILIREYTERENE